MNCPDLRAPTVSQRPLIWLNILCLDAPIVAITWQSLFTQVFGAAVPLGEREALFLTAWLIYLVDRFADSISLPADVPKAAREEFCYRHKNIWVGLIAVGGLLDGGVIFTSIGRETFILGTFLGAIAAAYLAINHAISKLWQTIPLKEIIVGFLFAAGTLLALAPKLPLVTPRVTLAAFLFATLCTLNCVSIAVWERDLDRAQGKHSIATRWPRMKLYVHVASFVLAGANGIPTVSSYRNQIAAVPISARIRRWRPTRGRGDPMRPFAAARHAIRQQHQLGVMARLPAACMRGQTSGERCVSVAMSGAALIRSRVG